MKKSNLAATILFMASKAYIVILGLLFLAVSCLADWALLSLILVFMFFAYPLFSLLTNTISFIIQFVNIRKNDSKKYYVMFVATIVSILFAVFTGWLFLEIGKSV